MTDPTALSARRETIEGRLQAGEPLRPLRPFDVLCFSVIDWEFRWQRPQQLMSALAAAGHRVFYLSVSRFLPIGGRAFESVELGPGVQEIRLAVPSPFDVYGGTLGSENRLAMIDSLRAVREAFDIRRALSIVEMATWEPVAAACRQSFGWALSYDCMDDWEDFPGINRNVIRQERELVRKADLVTVSSWKLSEKWSQQRETLLLRNATAYEHFQNASPIPELAGSAKPVIGFFGAIAQWFDVELMTSVAGQRSAYLFVFVGEVFDVDVRQLSALPNVRMEGARPYAEIPSYLAGFDVCLIPFRQSPITDAVDPVKFYEYLSAGKPVVSTNMAELKLFDEHLYVSKDEAAFLRNIDLALAEDDESRREARRELARRNDWRDRARSIELAAEKIFRRQAEQRISLNEQLDTPESATTIDLVTALADAEQEADILGQRVLTLSSEIAGLHEELVGLKQSHADEWEQRAGEMRQRDEVIRSLQKELLEKTGERDRMIVQQQSEAQRLIENINAMHQDLSRRDALIAEGEQRVRELMSAANEQQRVAQEQLSRSEATILALQQEISTIVPQVEQLSRSLTKTTNDYSHLEATSLALRSQLHAIHQSKFWSMASLYWKTRQKLGLLKGDPTPPSVRSSEAGTDPATLLSPDREPSYHSPEMEEEAWTEPQGYDVICWPIIDWDFRFQRPQQLMTQFAANGHRVFYIAQKFRSSGPKYKLRTIGPNLFEVSLRGPKKSVYTESLSSGEIETMFDAVDTLRREQSLGATVSVIQLPFWTSLAERARERFAWPMVYDCMDHHAGFTTNSEAMLDTEGRLLREADLVVVSSLFLESEARQHNRNVVLVRNGCDFEHFAAIAPETSNATPVIGYYGAIADWFDSDLVAELAARRPDWKFVLVGSTYSADISRLKRLGNVSLPGEKPYAEVPSWLESFDVCIIPFKRLPLTEATNPVKAYEMLAGGKPVVSVPIPEVAPLSPLVRLASTAAEFEQEIAASLFDRSPEIVTARQRFAAENTWKKRYEVMAPAVARAFPKVSIIIVTYNNVELNRLCLESVHRNIEWPNLEVFVVDNASKDSTPDYLREAEKEYPGLRVILNRENRGFAAANNQALREASGDFLVLLNNDTVSPRGWLAALIRHLCSDRSIGLIGPSTNAIGNEGMVPVGYNAVEEMPRWAAKFMRENDGKIFDIAMLAMFCVAMRREVFDKVGYLDENFGVGMYEDDDYAHRMKLEDFRIVCARDSFVHHWMKAAFGKIPSDEYQKLFDKNKAYYEKKWAVTWTPHKSA